MANPWETGSEFDRFRGYLQADGQTLRNKLGATNPHDLRRAEDPLVEYRAIGLRQAGIPATYDLEGLQAIHQHLFQDVYEWAGQLRTTEIRKGKAGHVLEGKTGFFTPRAQIADSVREVAEVLRETDNLRRIPQEKVPTVLAGVYDVVNQVHPFREGNGRTQREFVRALARESGHDIDWHRVTRAAPGIASENDRASEAARAGDPKALREMFSRIVTRPTAFDQHTSEALRLAQTIRLAQASRPTPGRVSPPGPARGQGDRPRPAYGTTYGTPGQER